MAIPGFAETLSARGGAPVDDGDAARLESEIGSLEVRVKLDPRQRCDVALMDKGGWLGSGRCANALVRARATDAGEGACYFDTAVRLVPIARSEDDVLETAGYRSDPV